MKYEIIETRWVDTSYWSDLDPGHWKEESRGTFQTRREAEINMTGMVNGKSKFEIREIK